MPSSLNETSTESTSGFFDAFRNVLRTARESGISPEGYTFGENFIAIQGFSNKHPSIGIVIGENGKLYFGRRVESTVLRFIKAVVFNTNMSKGCMNIKGNICLLGSIDLSVGEQLELLRRLKQVVGAKKKILYRVELFQNKTENPEF